MFGKKDKKEKAEEMIVFGIQIPHSMKVELMRLSACRPQGETAGVTYREILSLGIEAYKKQKER